MAFAAILIFEAGTAPGSATVLRAVFAGFSAFGLADTVVTAGVRVTATATNSQIVCLASAAGIPFGLATEGVLLANFYTAVGIPTVVTGGAVVVYAAVASLRIVAIASSPTILQSLGGAPIIPPGVAAVGVDSADDLAALQITTSF